MNTVDQLILKKAQSEYGKSKLISLSTNLRKSIPKWNKEILSRWFYSSFVISNLSPPEKKSLEKKSHLTRCHW